MRPWFVFTALPVCCDSGVHVLLRAGGDAPESAAEPASAAGPPLEEPLPPDDPPLEEPLPPEEPPLEEPLPLEEPPLEPLLEDPPEEEDRPDPPGGD